MENRNTNGSNWGKWDLHIHSNASDGKSSPSEIIKKAKECGLDVIALTDHHTVDNIDEIKRLGKEIGITVISGVEFRTEYGQKSVHIIGLFPDEYNGIALNQETLYDNILAPLNLTRSHIRNVARQDNPSLSDDDAAYKDGLLKVAVDFKIAAKKIREFGGIVTVHAGGKSNSIDVEMRHDGPGKSNVSELVDSLGPVKQELMENYIDVCEVRKAMEAVFYFEKFGKASIAASDAHRTSEIARNYVWIKAEKTFEGLRQIVYEPELRVRIQNGRPDEKNDYNIIESIEINDPEFRKQIIPFNEGLNSIIGGRSSGKSILLSCIAILGGSQTPPKNSKMYNAYIEGLTRHMHLTWRDHREGDMRRVDFFPQNYISRLASHPTEISKIIVRILTEDKIHEQYIRQLSESIVQIEREILDRLTTIGSLKQDYFLRKEEILKLGDRRSIEAEIYKIETQIAEIKRCSDSYISPDAVNHFQECNNKIAENVALQKEIKSAVEQLGKIKQLDLFLSVDSYLASLPLQVSVRIQNLYKSSADAFRKTWANSVQQIIEDELARSQSLSDEILLIKTDSHYIAEREHYEANQEYSILDSRLKKEREKRDAVISEENIIKNLNDRIILLQSEVIELQNSYYSKQKDYCVSAGLQKGEISILPFVDFKRSQFESFVDSYFDKRQGVNQYLFNMNYDSHEQFETVLEKCYHDLSNHSLQLKRNNDYSEVIQTLLQTNWYDVKYNIQFQGDDLSSMSEGKSAFVVLRLLLDFSKDECPILIDQPEDELDNRAIYNELVTYLRKKKCSRQVILVSHNPNIVVGADSEEVIVANKNGVNSPNQESVKFEYLSGALENSYFNVSARDDSPVLLRQGVREHVCEILEGGPAAFEAREKKYHFKE